MTHEEQVILSNGNKAADILNNEFFRSKVTELEQHIVNRWKNAENVADRETQWVKLQVLKELLTDLSLPVLFKNELEQRLIQEGENDEGY